MDQNTIPRVLLSVEEAAEALGIGRTNMYALIKRGDIESCKVGRLRRISQQALNDYVLKVTALTWGVDLSN